MAICRYIQVVTRTPSGSNSASPTDMPCTPHVTDMPAAVQSHNPHLRWRHGQRREGASLFWGLSCSGPSPQLHRPPWRPPSEQLLLQSAALSRDQPEVCLAKARAPSGVQKQLCVVSTDGVINAADKTEVAEQR